MVIFLFCFNLLLYGISVGYYCYFFWRQKKITRTITHLRMIKNKIANF